MDNDDKNENVKKASPAFFSLPGNPEIPALVRFWAAFITAANLLLMALGGFLLYIGLLASEDRETGARVLAGFFYIVVGLIMYRLGLGLRRGERASVYGFSLVGVIALGWSIYAISAKGKEVGLVLLIVTSVIFIPPLVASFLSWSKYR